MRSVLLILNNHYLLLSLFAHILAFEVVFNMKVDNIKYMSLIVTYPVVMPENVLFLTSVIKGHKDILLNDKMTHFIILNSHNTFN